MIGSSTLAYIRVLHERDEARTARGEAQGAAVKLGVAIHDAQSALRSQLIQNAEVVRMSSAADRRATGLDLLRRAATLPTGPGHRTQLRDEAVAFLAIRDVEHRPEVPVPEPSQGLAFGPNGQHLATLSEDGGTVRFWDVKSRSLIETHDLNAGAPRADGPPRGRGGRRTGNGPFGRLGTRIVASGEDIAVIQADNRGIRLFNAASGAITGNLRLFDRSVEVGPPEPEREIVSLAASTDGRRLVTVDRGVEARQGRADYQVHLWNAMNLDRPLASLYEPKPDSKVEPFVRNFPPLIAVSPDGSTVAVASSMDAEVSIWTRDGKAHDTIDSQAQLTALALGTEGLLAAAGNRAVHLWDLDNLNKSSSLPSLTPNLGFVDQLRFSPDDGTLLAVAGRGSGVELWDVAATAKVATLSLPGEWHGLAIAPKSKLLAVGRPTSLALWAVVDPRVLTQIGGFTAPLKNVAFGPDGGLVMVERFGTLRAWGVGHCPTSAAVVGSVQPSSFAIDPNQRLIALTLERAEGRGKSTTAGRLDDRLEWLSPPGFVPSAAIPLPDFPRSVGNRWPDGFRSSAQRIGLSADGRTLVMTRVHEVLVSRTLADGTPGAVERVESPDLPDPSRHDPTVTGRGERSEPSRLAVWRDIAINPAGDRFFLLSFGSEEVSAWSLKGHNAERLPWTIAGKFTSIALTNDGSRLAIGDRSGIVSLLDPETGRVVHRLLPPDGDATAPVDAVAFSPDGSELAVGTVDHVRVWTLRAAEPRPYVRLPGHRGPVLTLAYDRTGDRLASGGDDKTVKVWNLDRVRAELARLGLDEARVSQGDR